MQYFFDQIEPEIQVSYFHLKIFLNQFVYLLIEFNAADNPISGWNLEEELTKYQQNK